MYLKPPQQAMKKVESEDIFIENEDSGYNTEKVHSDNCSETKPLLVQPAFIEIADCAQDVRASAKALLLFPKALLLTRRMQSNI
jgi:hypothetical protein